MECLKRFLASPTEHLNDLNQIIPAIIDSIDVAAAIKLIKVLLKSEIVK